MHSPKRHKSNSVSTWTSNSSSSNNNEPIELCSREMDYIDDDGIVQPPGRKTSKGKRKMQCRDKLVANILAKSLVIIQQQCRRNQAELEMRRERALMMKDYELCVQELKMKIELKEKELAWKKKIEWRKRQHIYDLNLDPSKIVPKGPVIWRNCKNGYWRYGERIWSTLNISLSMYNFHFCEWGFRS